MSSAPRCGRLTALLVTGLLSSTARADVRLVLASDRGEPLGRRLDAEAAEIGLVLVPAVLRPGEAPRRVSEREQAAGVLHVVSAETVELWVSLPGGGVGRFETVRGKAENDEAFALRIVEEVRARFVELHVPDAEKLSAPSKQTHTDDSQENPAPDSARARTAPEPATPPSADRGRAVPPEATARTSSSGSFRLAATGGAGATFAAGGLGPGAAALAGLHLRLGAPLRLTARALLPFTSAGATANEGAADVRAYFFSVSAAYAPWADDYGASPWVAFGAGVGGALLTLDGRASPGYVAKNDTLGAAVPFLEAALVQNFGASFALEATLLGGVSVPRPIVRFDAREVAAWGRFVAAAMLAVDWTLPVGR